MHLQTLFATKIYRENLIGKRSERQALNKQIILEADDLSALDKAGRAWSKKNYPNGYTSYASVNELHKHSSTFERLEKKIYSHVKRYAGSLGWDLGTGKLQMTTCWLNIMPENTHHGLHIHPLSVISGTYYVDMPSGAPGIKFEDPRLDKMMAAPPIRISAKDQRSVTINAKSGELVLFESWLRHEVPINQNKKRRISVSFNYAWV
jgi:uncharacterized protein (TIGR02466 family)